MSLAAIVNVSITNTSPRVSQQGFGIPLVLGYHTEFPELLRFYTDLTGVAADFATTSPEYAKAAALFAQNPSPERIAIGRRSVSTPTYSWTLTPVELTEGYEYSLTVGTETFSYTVQAGDDADAIATALATAIGSATQDISAVDNTGSFNVNADNAGDYFQLTLPADESLRLLDNTSAAGGTLADDLNAIFTVDASWYALFLTTHSKAEIAAAGAWASSNDRLFYAESNDYELKDIAVTNDAASAAQALSESHTHVSWNLQPSQHLDGGHLGRVLPRNPGSATWEYKTISGVAGAQAAALTATHITALEGKNAGYYQEIAGVPVTRNMKMADGEWMDVRRGIDWTHARIQENIFALKTSLEKIPFTDAGIGLVVAAIEEVLRLGAQRGLYVEDSIVITAPQASQVNAADKNNRLLPDVKFQATLQGAIHFTRIEGAVSV